MRHAQTCKKGDKMKQTLAIAVLICAMLFFVGCTGTNVIHQTSALVKFNDGGSGTAKITFTGDSTYDSEIQNQLQSSFAARQNYHLDVSTVSSSENQYAITFDLTKPADLTAFSKFTKSPDNKYGVTYTYSDLISFSTLTGNTQSFSNFEYCVQMPGVAIYNVTFDGTEYSQYYGGDTACVPVDGSSTNRGQSLFIQSGGQKKQGCLYDNPSCDARHDCLNNTCVLKKGCDYDNPPCSDNYDCKANQCVLKPGCKYDNPPCGGNYNCVDNACVLKPGCLYNNPPCDDNHNCLNNTCILKVGCRYDNPSCSSYEKCNTEKNECEIHPYVILGVVFFMGAIIFAIFVYPILKKYLNSPKKPEQAPAHKAKEAHETAHIENKAHKTNDLKTAIVGASLLLKIGIAVVFLIGLLFFGYLAATNSLSMLCFGPVALFFLIFFVFSVIWVLDDLKKEMT